MSAKDTCMMLLDLIGLLRKRLIVVVAIPLVLTVVTAGISWGVLQNQYTAKVSVYVLSSKDSQGASGSTYNDLTASQLMANDIATLAKSATVQEKAAEALKLPSLKDFKISEESSTSTRVIDISVTGDNADATSVVANQLAKTLSSVAQQVMGVESVNVVDQAQVPQTPSGPPRGAYTVVAFLVGIFMSIALVVVLDMLNTRVRDPEEAESLLGIPVIGRIPTIKE